MLKKLELTCFMKHESRTFDFTEGLNCVRGANEACKSGMLLAIGYALFGSKVLPLSVDETVTWGRKPNELKVALHYGDFVVSRSKSGAEVVRDGKPFVTGQVEVTKFCESELGCDASTAGILMFSNQGSLRGTLDQGPKSTAQTIESLSGLSLFDTLLEAANEKLPLGSDMIHKERLNGLKAQLAMLELPERPDESAFCLSDDGLHMLIRDTEADLVPAQAESLKHYEAWKAESDKRWKRDSLLQDIEKYESQRRDTEKKRDAEIAQVFSANLEGIVLDLKARVEMEAGHAARVEAYRKFEAYKAPQTRIDETIDDVGFRLKNNTTATSTARTHIATLRGDIKALEATIVSGSVCGFCDRDVSQFPEVAAKNERTRAEIEGKRTEIAETEARIEGYKQDREVLDGLVEAQGTVDRLIRQIGAHLAVDTRCTPNLVTWKGEVPSGTATDSTPRLKEAESQLKALHARDARVEAYDGVLAQVADKIAKLHASIAELAVLPYEEYAGLEEAYVTASSKVSGLQQDIDALKIERETAAKAFTAAKEAWDRAAETQARLTSEIAQAEKDIASLAFNNALLKKIRACRPVVATKLWSLVLTSVSTLFSQMRGEKSVVTKGAGGFLVNGQSVEALSGSTKDILGLAIRCALTHTFLPGCPFLVLDEPGASMDRDRVGLMLGYIAASNFPQVILVTHDEVSETFANNLITL